MSITYTFRRRDSRGFTNAGSGVTFTVAVGPRGPNLITDSTAIGTLTEAVADALHLIASNAAGTQARKVAITSVVRALLQATTAAQARTAIGTDAAGDTRPPAAHTHPASAISDSTAVGRSLLTAADSAAARSAIGAGTGNALTSGTLAQFAATTSAELAGVLTDETGSGGGFVRATGPTLTTPIISGATAGRVAIITTGGVVADDAGLTYVSATPRLKIGTTSSFDVRLGVGGNSATTGFTGRDVNAIGISIGGTRRFDFASAALRLHNDWSIAWSGDPGVDPENIGISRVDSNTIEVNNGTRTGSGGAPRGLSVSTLTVATGATGGTGISVTGTGSNVEQIRITTGLGGAVPAIVLSQGAGGIPSGSVELSFSSPKLGLRRTGLDHFCYYSTATGDTVLDSVFGGAGAEIRSGGTLRIRATSAGTAITGPLTLGTYTVATLPSASANAGAFAQVTDSNSTTNGNTVAGGGSNRVPVFSNGTNWIIK